MRALRGSASFIWALYAAAQALPAWGGPPQRPSDSCTPEALERILGEEARKEEERYKNKFTGKVKPTREDLQPLPSLRGDDDPLEWTAVEKDPLGARAADPDDDPTDPGSDTTYHELSPGNGRDVVDVGSRRHEHPRPGRRAPAPAENPTIQELRQVLPMISGDVVNRNLSPELRKIAIQQLDTLIGKVRGLPLSVRDADLVKDAKMQLAALKAADANHQLAMKAAMALEKELPAMRSRLDEGGLGPQQRKADLQTLRHVIDELERDAAARIARSDILAKAKALAERLERGEATYREARAAANALRERIGAFRTRPGQAITADFLREEEAAIRELATTIRKDHGVASQERGLLESADAHLKTIADSLKAVASAMKTRELAVAAASELGKKLPHWEELNRRVALDKDDRDGMIDQLDELVQQLERDPKTAASNAPLIRDAKRTRAYLEHAGEPSLVDGVAVVKPEGYTSAVSSPLKRDYALAPPNAELKPLPDSGYSLSDNVPGSAGDVNFVGTPESHKAPVPSGYDSSRLSEAVPSIPPLKTEVRVPQKTADGRMLTDEERLAIELRPGESATYLGDGARSAVYVTHPRMPDGILHGTEAARRAWIKENGVDVIKILKKEWIGDVQIAGHVERDHLIDHLWKFAADRVDYTYRGKKRKLIEYVENKDPQTVARASIRQPYRRDLDAQEVQFRIDELQQPGTTAARKKAILKDFRDRCYPPLKDLMGYIAAYEQFYRDTYGLVVRNVHQNQVFSIAIRRGDKAIEEGFDLNKGQNAKFRGFCDKSGPNGSAGGIWEAFD